MLLEKQHTTRLSTLTHEGKLLLMATIVEDGRAQLWYTVKQDGFEDSALNQPGGTGWEDFKPLPLPHDTQGDPSVAAKEQADLTDKAGNALLRSIYDSAALTADAPGQLVSHDGHIYVFRQSTTGTLLVDRFVLDGMTNTLTPKLEVRFKRSRQRYAPLKDMKITSGGQMQSVDSLDFLDIDNQPFYEATTEICPNLVNNLRNGWFGVVVTPTIEPDNYRWHIFAHDSSDGEIDVLTLRAGDERIFDLTDYWHRSVDPITEKAGYDSIPGITRRMLQFQDRDGQPLTVTNGLAVTAYDVQREQTTDGGAQLVRDASKVLLAAPTANGVAALSFAIAADGRLAQITANGKTKELRSQTQEILLPLDLLDSIRPVAAANPAPAGAIAGLSRSTGDDSADRIRVQADQAVSSLKNGDTVKLSNTTPPDGLYRVATAGPDSFTIDAPAPAGKLGDWEQVVEEETGLIFDGLLTGYESTPDGKLKVYAVNHGLSAGDEVQILGGTDYSGQYPVLEHDSQSFTIDRLWANAEARNIRLESRKRHGLMLDGKNDSIAVDFSRTINLSAGFTVEAWVKPDTTADQTLLTLHGELPSDAAQIRRTDAANATVATLALRDGKFTFAISRPLLGRSRALRIDSETPARPGEWTHVACSFNGKELHLLENGAIKDTVTAEDLDRRAKAAQDATLALLEQDVANTPEGPDRVALRTELDALEARLKLVPPAFSLRAAALTLGATRRLNAGKLQDPGDFLQGQLAEARIWTAGRTDKAIADAMHLQLTGREAGLAGYWRLGGVAAAEDGSQRVFDFSVNANHGVALGQPYAGGVTLSLTLRNGQPAVKFSNGDLIAVREGASYVERFEFRTDKPVTPDKVDSTGAAIFTPSLWGRLSRGSDEKQAFAPLQAAYEFMQGEGNWQVATCRFVIPEGVRLLRGFEVADLAGDWTTLEVRRPTLRLVSDTVTLATLDETARLPVLTTWLADPGQPAALLADLAGREAQESQLVARRKELERLLNDAAEGATRQANLQERDACRTTIADLTAQETAAAGVVTSVGNDPLNFWCTLTPKDRPDIRLDGRSDGVMYQNTPQHNLQQRWKFEPLEGSDAGWYRITNAHSGKCADVQDPGIHQYQWYGDDRQKWRLDLQTDGYHIIVNKGFKDRVFDRPSGDGIVAHDRHGGNNQRWLLTKDGDAINNKVADAQQKLADVQQKLREARNKLDLLDGVLNATDSQRGAWQADLEQVVRQLAALRLGMAQLSAQYLDAIGKASRDAQSMPDLPGAKDPRGLAVQGALLPFARPAGRLHALESCTGRVILSYQDAGGLLRQAQYDTAYDADGMGEEWLPDGYTAALDLRTTSLALPLPAGVFSDVTTQVTIEFWARGDSELAGGTVFLAALDSSGKPVLRIQLPNANDQVVWEAGPVASLVTKVDQVAGSASRLRGRWTHWAFVADGQAGELRIYADGKLVVKTDPALGKATRFTAVGAVVSAALGGLPGQAASWPGQISELRIWNSALGEREVEANAALAVTGSEPGLVAWYPFNEGQGAEARDHTGRGHHIATGGLPWSACTAPLGRASTDVALPAPADAAVLCAEYSRVRVDAQQRKAAVMVRCLALPTGSGPLLLDEKRIDELEMVWIGNAQIKPTLIGFIEGAPPVPSENLTEEQDYNGATSVELVLSDDVAYSWTREKEGGMGADLSVFVGADIKVSAGLGVEEELLATRQGLDAVANFGHRWQNASTVDASHSLMTSDRVELRGSLEQEAHFPQLGRRFIPKNIGYAVVTSGLADVFISKLKRSGRMVGSQMLPVEGVPPDVNTITFLINPAYTMSGSLDGLTGSRATSDRFFQHVPEMRSQYGSLYPASYFRLKEAYDLKEQIDQQDKAHESYFNQFSTILLDLTSFDSQVDSGLGGDGAPSPSGPDHTSEEADLEQQIETAKAEKDKLTDEAAKQQKQTEIDGLEAKQKAARERQKKAQGDRKQAGEERQKQINSKYTDLSARANATNSFEEWQKKMEDLQLRAGKRNIVNTYVWDGDGGFHAEEQQFAGSVEHSLGGSLDFSGGIGGEGAFTVSGVAVALTGMANLSLTQTITKTERSSKGLELHVDLGGVESRNITDYRDYPVLSGEKVDRYRFMSFFLETSTDHWHDFFNYVVDPEWLASNDEEARALREAQGAAPNKVWRVLHRVTYVERPALMGLGRSVVRSDEAVDDMRALREQVADLQAKVAKLQGEINGKLDALLKREGVSGQ